MAGSDLVVGGPDAVGVTTSALAEQSWRFRLLAGELGESRRHLAAVDRVIGRSILGAVDAPRSAVLAEAAIDEAEGALARAGEHCDALARGLENAAHGYETVDRLAARVGHEAAAGVGYLAGLAAPGLLAWAMPWLLVAGGVAAATLLGLSSSGRARVGAAFAHWFRRHSAMLSDPGFVEVVRLSVMSVDDAAGGVTRTPPALVHALGDGGLGILGVDTSAAVLAGVALGAGVIRESPVSVRVVSETTRPESTGPESSRPEGSGREGSAGGIRERAARIPLEPEQIRIDRYRTPGAPDRFEVYLAGTAELALAGDAEPWDMTSNLVAMGGGEAGSLRAVREALRVAGVTSDSPMTLTGYSQGGLLAAQLAASGDYQVHGLVTLGAPAGQVAVPREIPYLAVEHSNDLVPALGGAFASSEPLVVRRTLFDGPPPPSEYVLPAHRLDRYLETAQAIDGSADPRIERMLARLDQDAAYSVASAASSAGNQAATQATTVTSTVFIAERTRD